MGKSLRVLVVEDRAEDAELTVRELRRADLNCETIRVDSATAFRGALEEFRPDIRPPTLLKKVRGVLQSGNSPTQRNPEQNR